MLICSLFLLSISPTSALSPGQIAKQIQNDLNIAQKQIQANKTKFWDLQLEILSSPEANAIGEKYRLVNGLQIPEQQFLVESALIKYREQVMSYREFQKFYPALYQKLLEVIDIWIEKRGGRRGGSSDDTLPGQLRNEFPDLVDLSLSIDSMNLMNVLVLVSKSLEREKNLQKSKFDQSFRFYYNVYSLERLSKTTALTPKEQQRGKIVLKDLKSALLIKNKFNFTAANKFNVSVGNKYLYVFNDYDSSYKNFLDLYKGYIKSV